MKNILSTLLVSIVLLSTACSDSRFSIEGQFSDTGTQNLQAVYLTGDSIVSMWVPAVNGSFRFEGNSDKITVVYLFSSQRHRIAHIAAKNGDEIHLSGSMNDLYNLKIEGSDINIQWNQFINDHANDFKAADYDKIDREIARFVKKNPDNVVSTLLLTCDYSDITSPEAKKLLQSIAEDAKPEQLTSLYSNAFNFKDISKKRLTNATLRNEKDSLEIVRLNEKKSNLAYFWRKSDPDGKKTVEQLKKLKKTQVIDICIDSDTLTWRSTVENDSTGWRHFKAIAGPVDRTILNLEIKGSPYFIVTDSIGNTLYRGSSVETAVDKSQK